MNLLVSSHVWRQDHNGFSHQDPGVTSVLLNKCFHNDHVIGIYFATDANMLLAIARSATSPPTRSTPSSLVSSLLPPG